MTNNKDAFYAEYNDQENVYVFTGLRSYLLDIINKKGGVASAGDMNFVIMPIDVTKYSNTTSSYYYYASSVLNEVITKIAPAVSRPCMAKLNLKKAKIKLTYSKQTLY